MDQASTIAEEQELLAEDFGLFDEPREKIEYILDLGKDLPPLTADEMCPDNMVRGCQSQVWMVADYDAAADQMKIRADSDAFIVKGLIAMLLRLYSGRAPRDILENPPEVFERIGLGRLLTPGRSNGLYSMVKRIRELAAGYVPDKTGVVAAE